MLNGRADGRGERRCGERVQSVHQAALELGVTRLKRHVHTYTRRRNLSRCYHATIAITACASDGCKQRHTRLQGSGERGKKGTQIKPFDSASHGQSKLEGKAPDRRLIGTVVWVEAVWQCRRRLQHRRG